MSNNNYISRCSTMGACSRGPTKNKHSRGFVWNAVRKCAPTTTIYVSSGYFNMYRCVYFGPLTHSRPTRSDDRFVLQPLPPNLLHSKKTHLRRITRWNIIYVFRSIIFTQASYLVFQHMITYNIIYLLHVRLHPCDPIFFYLILFLLYRY